MSTAAGEDGSKKAKSSRNVFTFCVTQTNDLRKSSFKNHSAQKCFPGFRHYFDDDSVSEGEEEESSCKEPVPSRSKPTSETPQEENGVVNDPALKDSYDFYLNYYSEKYGVNQPKQQASKPDTKIEAVTEKQNVKNTAPGPTIESKSGVPKVMVSSGGLGGLVADYSGSDSD